MMRILCAGVTRANTVASPSTASSLSSSHASRAAPVLTGADLDAWDDDKLDAVLGEATVFARVTPAHKMRIIRAYQRIGRTVAMTGDGANDAPAIRSEE